MAGVTTRAPTLYALVFGPFLGQSGRASVTNEFWIFVNDFVSMHVNFRTGLCTGNPNNFKVLASFFS